MSSWQIFLNWKHEPPITQATAKQKETADNKDPLYLPKMLLKTPNDTAMPQTNISHVATRPKVHLKWTSSTELDADILKITEQIKLLDISQVSFHQL